jgi:hypothetical protein
MLYLLYAGFDNEWSMFFDRQVARTQKLVLQLTWRQQADQRALLVAFCPRALHTERHALHKALAQRITNVVSCRHQRPVLAEGLDHAHALKLAQAVLIIRHLQM